MMECCEMNLPPNQAQARNGEMWTCPECGEEWEHVCSESDGCWWESITDIEGDLAAEAKEHQRTGSYD